MDERRAKKQKGTKPTTRVPRVCLWWKLIGEIIVSLIVCLARNLRSENVCVVSAYHSNVVQ